MRLFFIFFIFQLYMSSIFGQQKNIIPISTIWKFFYIENQQEKSVEYVGNGTGFFIGNRIYTAKHVLAGIVSNKNKTQEFSVKENTEELFLFYDEESGPKLFISKNSPWQNWKKRAECEVKKVTVQIVLDNLYYPKAVYLYDKKDIAVIIPIQNFEDIKKYKVASAQLDSAVVCCGYDYKKGRHPETQSLVVTRITDSMIGLKDINSKVIQGYSGGPVLNEQKEAIGIITNSSQDGQCTALPIPKEEIAELDFCNYTENMMFKDLFRKGMYNIPTQIWWECCWPNDLNDSENINSLSFEKKYLSNSILDMTTEYWRNLSIEQQFLYARTYQEGYCQRKNVSLYQNINLGKSEIRMCLIPPGCFFMGTSKDDEAFCNDENQHKVIIDYPFWMQATEFSQGQYDAIMGNEIDRNIENFPLSKDWNTVKKIFIPELKNRFPTYNWRLPTEDEWEYCCRAGTLGRYFWPVDSKKSEQDIANDSFSDWGISLNEISLMGEYSNVFDKSSFQKFTEAIDFLPVQDTFSDVAPIASLKPNAFGLYDMIGNMKEWCEDDYVRNYLDKDAYDNFQYDMKNRKSAVRKSKLPQPRKILRGGGYKTDVAHLLRCAYRESTLATQKKEDIGFRLVIDQK